MKRLPRKLLKSLHTSDQLFMIVMAISVGLLAAFGAVIFRFLIKFAHYLFFRTDSYSLEVIQQFPVWEKILLPVIGGLIVGPIVFWVAQEISGSGIPEVIEATALRGGSIRKRVTFAKMFATAITIGSGGSAGREGPIVQVGSSIGSALGQFLRVSGKQLRTLTACGAAAGIAVTFNAPIAGALFSIEVILGDLAVHYFSPIVIASVTATIISSHFLGYFPAFNIPAYRLVSSFEFLPYALLGILAGLISVLFIKTMSLVQDISAKISIPRYLKPALGGLVVGVIGVFLPQVYGIGYESINNALWGRDIDLVLFILVFAKIIATTATLGSGGSGGIFAPSLFIGAALGALVGDLFHTIFPMSTAGAGAYALVGMGAVVSGVTHAPISSILIVFELTNDYRILPALMIACILSILVASRLCKESMYTLRLVKKGINIYRGKDVNLLKNILVRDVYTTDIATVSDKSPFEEIVKTVDQHPTREVFVVNDAQEFVGTVSYMYIRNSLLRQGGSLKGDHAIDFAKTDIIPLFLNDTLDLAIQQFGKINEDELPVLIAPDNRKLVGSVRLKDVINAYNRELRHWDLTGGTHTIVTAVMKGYYIDLSDNACLAELDLPGGFAGQSLKAIDLQGNYNIHIVLIHKASAGKNDSQRTPDLVVPTPEYVFDPGDKILVIGEKKDIKRLQEA